MFSSCKKDETETSITNDDYYVKYKISSNYPNIFSNWSVTTPQGNYTKNNYQTRLWEDTYGPVKKGLSVWLKLKMEHQPLKFIFRKIIVHLH
jgi:hypothetical protein